MSLKKGNITISGLGSAGSDGYSPSANVSQSGDITTISITDKNGTTTASIDLSDKQDIIQYSTMPTASASNEGQIVQYVGTTDSTYTNGYFYKCVEDTNVYSWENIGVQASGGGNVPLYLITGNNQDSYNAFNACCIKFDNNEPFVLLLKYYHSQYSRYLYAPVGITRSGNTINLSSIIGTAFGGDTMITTLVNMNCSGGWGTINRISFTLSEAYTLRDYATSNGSGGLSVSNTTAYIPTSNYHPSTKLYTDKTHYENMTGYDATKTQVLKNISGTLTWVDEA